MRIAIFTDSFWPQVNGVTVSILNMAESLADQGHSFLIYAPKPHVLPPNPPSHKNIEIVWLPSKPLPTYTDYLIAYSFSKHAENMFWDFAPELVHIHTPFFVASKGIELAKKARIPVIGTFHTLISDFLEYVPLPVIKNHSIMKQLTWAYTRHFYGKCNQITTPTPILARELEEHGFRDVISLSNAIDYDLFAKTKPLKKNKRKGITSLVYFGRVSFEKRLDVAVEAVSLLQKKGLNVELHLIGGGPAQESLSKQANALGIHSLVHFSGPFRGKKLVERVKMHDMLVAPSPMETQGLYVLESMAAGIPIVGCNARAIPTALGKNERGLLFKNGNAADCAEKIETFINQPALRRKLTIAAKKWVKQYGKKTIAMEWEKLYRSLILK